MLGNSVDPDVACRTKPGISHIDAEKPAESSSHSHVSFTRKYRPARIANTLRVADITALLLAGFIGHAFRFGVSSPFSAAEYLLVYLGIVVTVVALHLANCYRVRDFSSLSTHGSTLFIGGTGALSVILICGFLSGTLQDYSRIWMTFSVTMAAVLLMLNRIVAIKLMDRAIRTKRLMESIVIVGANEHAEKMINAILDSPSSAINILSIFDDRAQRTFPESLQHRVLGSTNHLISYIRSNHVDRVVVTLPWIASDRINTLLKKLRTVPVRIDLVPNDIVWQFSGINMERLGSVPVLTVANGRIEEQGGMIKRMEDLLLSSLIFALLSPVLILIFGAIKLESNGPALFKQRRHGYNNRVFEVYKFRSMQISDDARMELKQATRDDPRVTRVGKFLRRSSLDELPQLINVLKGEMSIVGPRPHAVQHNIEYSSTILEYFARHNVKPGITGWAQINGLRGETDTIDKMCRRVEADLYYIENWSLMMDLKIICKTAIYVWFQKNAY